LHRIWVAEQILADTRLAPMESRAVAYEPALPGAGQGPFTVQARLLYRDVSPDFAEFALYRPVTDLPIFEVTSAELSISPQVVTPQVDSLSQTPSKVQGPGESYYVK
jgi:hypothetical protein